MSRLTILIFALFLAGQLAVSSIGQTPTPSPTPTDETDIASWNDISLTVPVHEKVDVSIPFTFRFNQNIGRLNEGRVGIGLVLKPHKRFSVAPTYLYIRSRNTANRFATENRLTVGMVYRFPVKVIGLSHKSTFEFRFRSSGNSWRYRPAITVEKELPERWVKGMKVFVTEDPFYNSATGSFSRNRLSFGVNKTLSKNLSLDLYYLRQDDNSSSPAVTHVLGTGWKIKF